MMKDLLIKKIAEKVYVILPKFLFALLAYFVLVITLAGLEFVTLPTLFL